MSRSFPEDEFRNFLDEKGVERYQRGDSSLLIAGKAERLTEFYLNQLSGNNSRGVPADRDFVSAEIEKMVRGVIDSEGFDPQLYVDKILLGLARHANNRQAANVDLLVRPLIQTLYDNGHNNLVLDMQEVRPGQERCEETGFYKQRSQYIACQLEGREEAPLSLEVIVSAEESKLPGPRVGSSSRHCRITVKGQAWTVGFDSYRSRFYLEFPNTRPSQYDEDCLYFISGVSEVHPVPREQREIFGKQSVGLSNGEEMFWLGARSLEGTNRFYVPDSATLRSGLRARLKGFRARLESTTIHDGWLEVKSE